MSTTDLPLRLLEIGKFKIKFFINDGILDWNILVHSKALTPSGELPTFWIEDVLKSWQPESRLIFDFSMFIGYECNSDTFEALKQSKPYKEIYITRKLS